MNLKGRIILLAVLLGVFAGANAQEVGPEALNLGQVISKIGYPQEARKAGVSGTVMARVSIDEKGKVTSHEIVESPSPVLTDAVSAELPGLKFRPAMNNGEKISSIVEIPFTFSLEGNDKVYTSINEARDNPQNIEMLDLSGQNLEKIDKIILKFPNLRQLTLDNNQIKKVPKWLKKLNSLESLSIAGNQLTKASGSLKKMNGLHRINLSGNPLSDADKARLKEIFRDAELTID